MKRTLSIALLLSVLSGSVGCSSYASGKTVGENIDDARIVAIVKSKLVVERPKNVSVGVTSDHGVVTLDGTVETLEHRFDAERIARTVSGVKDVVNNVRVASSPAQGSPSARTVVAVRQTVMGEVTDVDSGGRITIRTLEGDFLQARLPADALRGLRRGDRVTVEVAITPER